MRLACWRKKHSGGRGTGCALSADVVVRFTMRFTMGRSLPHYKDAPLPEIIRAHQISGVLTITWRMKNRRRFMERPRNWLCFTSSYKLTLRSSNTRHRWLLCMKKSRILTMWCLLSGSPLVFKNWSTPTSTRACIITTVWATMLHKEGRTCPVCPLVTSFTACLTLTIRHLLHWIHTLQMWNAL